MGVNDGAREYESSFNRRKSNLRRQEAIKKFKEQIKVKHERLERSQQAAERQQCVLIARQGPFVAQDSGVRLEELEAGGQVAEQRQQDRSQESKSNASVAHDDHELEGN